MSVAFSSTPLATIPLFIPDPFKIVKEKGPSLFFLSFRQIFLLLEINGDQTLLSNVFDDLDVLKTAGKTRALANTVLLHEPMIKLNCVLTIGRFMGKWNVLKTYECRNQIQFHGNNSYQNKEDALKKAKEVEKELGIPVLQDNLVKIPDIVTVYNYANQFPKKLPLDKQTEDNLWIPVLITSEELKLLSPAIMSSLEKTIAIAAGLAEGKNLAFNPLFGITMHQNYLKS